MTGLAVAPTAPQRMDADSSAGSAESFQSFVAVVRLIVSSGGSTCVGAGAAVDMRHS